MLPTPTPPDPMTGGGALLIREVRAGDEAAIEQLLGGLDAESRYRRWFTGGVDIRGAEEWAAHPERVAGVGLLAVIDGQAVGHAVLIPSEHVSAEVAFEVAAPWRRHGIASALLARLLEAAADRGLREIYADVLPENADMLAVLREHGEHVESRDGGIMIITIAAPPRAAR
jgi:GNAT superfamily N-acetyltransferase